MTDIPVTVYHYPLFTLTIHYLLSIRLSTTIFITQFSIDIPSGYLT